MKTYSAQGRKKKNSEKYCFLKKKDDDIFYWLCSLFTLCEI